MARFSRSHRAIIGTLGGAWLLLLGILVPALEGADGGRRAVLESEHSNAACAVAHDHKICTQVGANRAVSSSAAGLELAVLALVGVIHGAPAPLPADALDIAHNPRGPPEA